MKLTIVMSHQDIQQALTAYLATSGYAPVGGPDTIIIEIDENSELSATVLAEAIPLPKPKPKQATIAVPLSQLQRQAERAPTATVTDDEEADDHATVQALPPSAVISERELGPAREVSISSDLQALLSGPTGDVPIEGSAPARPTKKAPAQQAVSVDTLQPMTFHKGNGRVAVGPRGMPIPVDPQDRKHTSFGDE